MARANSISSVAYATEERASEGKTVNATTFDRRSPLDWTLDRGMPISHRLMNMVPTLAVRIEAEGPPQPSRTFCTTIQPTVFMSPRSRKTEANPRGVQGTSSA